MVEGRARRFLDRWKVAMIDQVHGVLGGRVMMKVVGEDFFLLPFHGREEEDEEEEEEEDGVEGCEVVAVRMYRVDSSWCRIMMLM